MIEGTLDRPVLGGAVPAPAADAPQQPGRTTPRLPAGATRTERLAEVARVADRWADEVSRLGGRNTLLRYQDLKAGTLDLAAADPEGRKRLLGGEPVLVSRLFPHEPLRTSAVRSARALHRKVRELAEERGIWAGHLAVGIATWAEPYVARRPAVPVFLRRLAIEPSDPVEADFLLTVDDEPQVNPVLLLAMATRVGIRLEADDLRDPRGRLRYPYVVDRLREHAPAHVVDGFAIAHRAVLATFTDDVLTTAASLRSEAPRLGTHPMARLLAGVDAVSPLPPATSTERQPLVLDADDAQAATVDAVVSGGSLVLLAGPGTGLTQTLANAVARLVAQGRTVLVTAEPRAPLADLGAALHRVGLGDAVLDLRPDVPEQDALAAVRTTVAAAATAPVPQARDPRPRDDAGDLLEAHAAWSRTPVAPWGISPYEAQAALLTAPTDLPAGLRLAPEVVAGLHGSTLAQVRSALGDLADSGGLDPVGTVSSWDGAHLDDELDAAAAVDAARRLLRDGLPSARDAATRAAVELGHPVPASLGEALALVVLLDEVRDTLETFLPDVWTAPLDDLVAATGDRAWRSEHPGSPSALTRRRLRRTARDLRLNPEHGSDGPDLQQALIGARDRLLRWRRSARDDRPPRLAEHSALAITTVAAAGEDLGRLVTALPDAGLAALPYAELSRRLTTLVTEQTAAHRLPRLRSLRRRLAQAGLEPLVAALTTTGRDRTGALAALDRLWHVGVLDAARVHDPLREVADPQALVDRFRVAEDRALAAHALETRARYGTALRAAVTADGAPHVTLAEARTLAAAVDGAPSLVLAAKPVWLVPTLRVAKALPAAHRFDVVVVEAAHLLDVASAVPALTRARRSVIAGDPVGVPPVEFSIAAEPELEPDTDGTGSGGRALTGSLLDAVRASLPVHRLRTHYRCADERLVRLAAARLSGTELAAWPGSDGGRALRLDLVTQPPLLQRQEESVVAEVAHVVDLVLDHARHRPQLSLAVLTLGARHAERVREGIRAALVQDRELEPFFALDRPEPFTVQSLDHVRAEVRDVVVLSVGYGRTAEGRLLYRFGALAQEGGDRRLAAATTRARESLVVVSTFRGEDMNPRRLLADGPRLLRELLLLADSAGSAAADGGSVVDDERAQARTDGAGERWLHDDLVRRLRAARLPVVTDVGYGPLRVAVALRDPDPSGPDLAILTDADGASAASARQRDRVVPRHLERLGWQVVRVWASRWVADPDAELARIMTAWESARRGSAPSELERGAGARGSGAAERSTAVEAPVSSSQPERGSAGVSQVADSSSPVRKAAPSPSAPARGPAGGGRVADQSSTAVEAAASAGDARSTADPVSPVAADGGAVDVADGQAPAADSPASGTDDVLAAEDGESLVSGDDQGLADESSAVASPDAPPPRPQGGPAS